MKIAYREEEVTDPSFLTSALDGVGGHLHTSAALPQEKEGGGGFHTH
jgi:hypothetical protein